MSSNTSGGNKVYVLYKVSNHKYDSGHSNSGQYNAFTMSRPSSTGIVTLAEVKRQCLALRSLHDLGPHGYHWRVRVDDARQQPQPKSSNPSSSYTWWDVIDENSRLPVKENVPLSELEQLLGHHHHQHHQQHSSRLSSSHALPGSGSTGVRTGVVAGAVRKAFQNVASTVEEVVNISSNTNNINASDIDFNEPRVSFLVFKLLDLIKLQKEYNSTDIKMTTTAVPRRVSNRTDGPPKTPLAPPSRPSNAAAPIPSAQRRTVPDMRPSTGTTTTTTTTSSSSSSTPLQRNQQPNLSQSIPIATANRPNVVQQRGGGVPAPRSTSSGTNAPTTTTTSSSRITVTQPLLRTSAPTSTTKAPARSSSEELLMDFGPTTTSTSATTSFHRSYSVNTPSFSQETKEEKLKREYAEKAKQQNRVWDPVDERWVVVESDNLKTGDGRVSGDAAYDKSNNNNATSAKIKGITLDDASNAVGKSANVQSAVQQRVTEMKMAQEKAKEELKQRKELAASLEQEEDTVRVKLDPKIKQWSEEHGKKKQLAALLASLHLVIWPEAQWKPVNLGDLLEEKKLRSCYKRASLKVHPDKTKDLNAEQRFLAKRIFDALTQAMTAYEDAKRS